MMSTGAPLARRLNASRCSDFWMIPWTFSQANRARCCSSVPSGMGNLLGHKLHQNLSTAGGGISTESHKRGVEPVLKPPDNPGSRLIGIFSADARGQQQRNQQCLGGQVFNIKQ